MERWYDPIEPPAVGSLGPGNLHPDTPRRDRPSSYGPAPVGPSFPIPTDLRNVGTPKTGGPLYPSPHDVPQTGGPLYPGANMASAAPASFMHPGGGLDESDVLETIFKQLGL